MGNKYSILDQLVWRIPTDISTFREIFCGSGVVSLNVSAKNYVLTDINPQLIELHNCLMNIEFCKNALDLSNTYLSDIDDYLRLRKDYNENPTPDKFLLLIYRSFSNQIRFNSSGEFNMPYGARNTFNWAKIVKHFSVVMNESVEIYLSDFRDALSSISDDDFVFIDPPYYNSVATYNDGWSAQDEIDLYELIGQLKCRWMLTNTLENRGVENKYLTDFVKGYNVTPINSSFNYDKFRKTDHKKKEIIVTNYKV
jgi:DNA adenine methylase Dam